MLQEVMDKFDTFGFKEHMYPNAIGMWKEEQESLVWSCLNVSPDSNWMEIGSFMGGSACLMCIARRLCGNKPNVVSVDVNFKAWGKNFDRNLYRIGKFQDIHQKLECSSFELDRHYDGSPLSFCFIDGWHSFKGVLSDFLMVNRWMVKDGIVAFHDTAPQPYKDGQIVEFYESEKTYKNEWLKESLPQIHYKSDTEYFQEIKYEQNFMIDQVIALVINEYNYELVDLPTINGQTHFDRVVEYIHGTTSPYPGFVALRKR